MSKMSKMILLSPDQFAKLLKEGERVIEVENKREQDLSGYVKSLGRAAPKAEQFDRYQSLFNRFVADQRRAREPIKIPIQEDDDGYEDDNGELGGLSFRRGSESDVETARSTHRLSSVPSFRGFIAGKKRKSTSSTPKIKTKRKKTTEVTPRKELLNASRKLRWRKVELK